MIGKEAFMPGQESFQLLAENKKDSSGEFQAQCNLPCGQPCVCSCHVVKTETPKKSYRFNKNKVLG